MIIETNSICNDLLAIPIENGFLDLSWSVDTDELKKKLENLGITKILNFYDNINFSIEIDSVNTFDSINKKEYNFSEIDKKYVGKMVFSVVIPFNKNKFEETTYYFRVKLTQRDSTYRTYYGDFLTTSTIEFSDTWSNFKQINIPRNYTKDIIDSMYTFVADNNAYSKEAKSANFYYLFQAFATVLNKQNTFVIEQANNNFIDEILPDNIEKIFGTLFKFSGSMNINSEEYRRIIRELIKGFQNGGSWNYISSVLKYLIGYSPKLVNFNNFYPWIVRSESLQAENPDPNPFSNRNYNNPGSNYYLYYKEFNLSKNNNSIMLLKENFRKFSFVVKSNNFFNNVIEEDKIKTILNLLKSAYLKYYLAIDEYEEYSEYYNMLLVDDDNILIANDEEYIQF